MTTNSMELARQPHLSLLYDPRAYRPGKLTNIGAGSLGFYVWNSSTFDNLEVYCLPE
jgi:hypothetical protein